MQLVPYHLVRVLLGPNWERDVAWTSLRANMRHVGSNVEVDVDAARGAVRDALVGYLDANRLIGGALLGQRRIENAMVCSRSLASYTQGAGSASRTRGDLHDQYHALREIRETELVVDGLLAARVDEESLVKLGVEVVARGENRTVVRARVEGTRQWPSSLGGGASVNEIERIFTLSSNHAAWRDRSVRRLCRVDVVGVELLADPGPYLAQIEAAAR